MKNGLVFLTSMLLSISSFAGALRVPDNKGETYDYGLTSAYMRNGEVTLEGRIYRNEVNGAKKEVERKYFKIGAKTLNGSGVSGLEPINFVLNKSILGDVFCEVEDFGSKRSSGEFECSSLSIAARLN